MFKYCYVFIFVVYLKQLNIKILIFFNVILSLCSCCIVECVSERDYRLLIDRLKTFKPMVKLNGKKI